MESTPASAQQLYELVLPKIAYRWHDIGIQLGFNMEELDKIDRELRYNSVDESCSAMLQHWKRKTSTATAVQLINAIEESGNALTASRLCKGWSIYR